MKERTALDTLGQILTEPQGRDAVHIAVIDVTAGEQLSPNDDVVLVGDMARLGTNATKGECVGVVDPFLNRDVQIGERFWLWVYPRTITSLRHEWTHPKIGDTRDEITNDKLARVEQIADSQRALQEFVAQATYAPYDVVITAMIDAAKAGSDWVQVYGYDADGSIPKEIWEHLEIVIDEELPKRPAELYFSCAC